MEYLSSRIQRRTDPGGQDGLLYLLSERLQDRTVKMPEYAGDGGGCGRPDFEVQGYGCEAGRNYAVQEVTAPKRIVTTTVAVSGKRDILVPVRTSEAVDKSAVERILSVCSRLKVRLPVSARRNSEKRYRRSGKRH